MDIKKIMENKASIEELMINLSKNNKLSFVRGDLSICDLIGITYYRDCYCYVFSIYEKYSVCDCNDIIRIPISNFLED